MSTMEVVPLGGAKMLAQELIDRGARDEDAAPDPVVIDLARGRHDIEEVLGYGQDGPNLLHREEVGRHHNSPRKFWINERVLNRRTLIRPFTRNRPHDIDMPTSLANSPTVSDRRRACAMNLLMSSLSPSDAFMFII